ncbi:MAG: hypothetical protein LBP59_12420 [Planctomycetaceae bacterium]|nr:hypothetical protein [Planctomycetaceae bacterium]
MLSLTGQIGQIYFCYKKYRIAGISPGLLQIRRRDAGGKIRFIKIKSIMNF